jgi:ATP-binding cassette subfamily F protein uup
MDRIVDHLFVFEGNGIIRDFPGNYAEYREEQTTKQQPVQQQSSKSVEVKIKEQEPVSPKRKPTFNEKKEFDQLEKEIKKLGQEKEVITERMTSADLDYAEIEKLSARFKQISDQIDTREIRWLELSDLFE